VSTPSSLPNETVAVTAGIDGWIAGQFGKRGVNDKEFQDAVGKDLLKEVLRANPN